MEKGKSRGKIAKHINRKERYLEKQEKEASLDFLQVNTIFVKERLISETEEKLLELKNKFDTLSSEIQRFLKSK